jgi:hypothetical protein
VYRKLATRRARAQLQDVKSTQLTVPRVKKVYDKNVGVLLIEGEVRGAGLGKCGHGGQKLPVGCHDALDFSGKHSER